MSIASFINKVEVTAEMKKSAVNIEDLEIVLMEENFIQNRGNVKLMAF